MHLVIMRLAGAALFGYAISCAAPARAATVAAADFVSIAQALMADQPSVRVDTRGVDLGVLSLPRSLTFSNTFTPESMAALGLTPADTFYDNYAFTIPDASFSSITATFNLADVLQVTDLQARLYSGTLSTAVSTLVTWSAPITTGVGFQNAISPITLGSGSYVLQVRGQVTGTAGGSYVGLLNVSSVPEPQSAALLGAGLLAGVLGLRRRNSHQS